MNDMRNAEGLTFEEWYHAAGYDLLIVHARGELVTITEAWERGEDPTDHRAAQEHERQQWAKEEEQCST